MKQLPPGPAPWTPKPLPTWVVFEVTTGPSGYHLREVARVLAGNESAAIISAAESRLDKKGGPRIALPLERVLRPRHARVHVYVTIE